MSGHNKWSQIKRQKGAEDSKKSRLFGVLTKMIAAEARRVGGDRNSAALRAVIEKARTANMPNENIDRAIRQGTEKNIASRVEILYEAYGPGGVAILIEGTTNNNNRTAQEIRHLLAEHGTNLVTPGSVTWAFKKVSDLGWLAETTTTVNGKDREKLNSLLAALEKHADIRKVISNCQN